MKILLADDDSKIHIIVNLWLSRNEHKVVCAKNGVQALEELDKGYFDCLISDVNMPLMNGIQLAKAAVKLTKAPELIIMMTSRCDLIELKDEIESAKIHLFHKPFSPARLAQLIEELSVQKIA